MWAASSRTAARSGSMASTSGKGEGAVIIAPLEYQTCVRAVKVFFPLTAAKIAPNFPTVWTFKIQEAPRTHRRISLPELGRRPGSAGPWSDDGSDPPDSRRCSSASTTGGGCMAVLLVIGDDGRRGAVKRRRCIRASRAAPTLASRTAPRRRSTRSSYAANPSWPQLKDGVVRFRARFPYVDGVMPDGDLQPLCRLRYGGYANVWGFAFYAGSSGSYEDSILPSGSFIGAPEEALD